MDNASLTKLSFQLKTIITMLSKKVVLFMHIKGLIGRISPIIVHASIILVLFGSVIGSASGFMTQELVPTNTSFSFTQYNKFRAF